jgi:hypothetical protein
MQNKYSCGNDPQPGDVVEVVTMEDLPEFEKSNWAVEEGLEPNVKYTVKIFDLEEDSNLSIILEGKMYWQLAPRFRLIRRAGEPDNKRNIFEELIQTIERTAVNNTATISNVKLWAKSWREEWVGEPERERGWTINGEQPQPDMAKLIEEKEREIERLKEQVNDLKMDAAAHEYNEAERIKFQPEYERQLLEEKNEAIRELVSQLVRLKNHNDYHSDNFDFDNIQSLITKYKQP